MTRLADQIIALRAREGVVTVESGPLCGPQAAGNEPPKGTGTPAATLAERVAHNIAAMRKTRGLTTRALEERLAAAGNRVAHSSITKVERGTRAVSLGDLAALALVFGLSNPWELTGDICPTCANTPPVGYRCLACDRTGEAV